MKGGDARLGGGLRETWGGRGTVDGGRYISHVRAWLRQFYLQRSQRLCVGLPQITIRRCAFDNEMVRYIVLAVHGQRLPSRKGADQPRTKAGSTAGVVKGARLGRPARPDDEFSCLLPWPSAS